MLYRVWDKEKSEYWNDKMRRFCLEPNGDVEIYSPWNKNHCEFYTFLEVKSKFKIEKHFAFLSDKSYYEGDIIRVKNMVNTNTPSYIAEIVWDNYAFKFRVIANEIDYKHFTPLMYASTFLNDLDLIGNINKGDYK